MQNSEIHQMGIAHAIAISASRRGIVAHFAGITLNEEQRQALKRLRHVSNRFRPFFKTTMTSHKLFLNNILT
jgi:hypothetical protein